MPQVFRAGEYYIYFWTNEGRPLEPVHVHISRGKPVENATKIWITRSGRCLLCNNKSNIPKHTLNNLLRMIEARSSEAIKLWSDYFGSVEYYC